MNKMLESFKNNIKGKKAAVIGVGISNVPLIRWLCSLGVNVTAFDRLEENDPSISKTKSDFKAEGLDIEWSLGSDYLDRLMGESF